MNTQSVREVQLKILEVMKFIDRICRDNNITYFIMGGTALGAIRHGGFIPWDDDLDIFMTPQEYNKFVDAFNKLNNDKFVIQEWKTTEKYLEYAKVRMNGTTLIEHNFRDRKNMHHGIYVDIMILHKTPLSKYVQRLKYYACKYVTLLGLSQRNWKPKTNFQGIALNFLKVLPNRLLAKYAYEIIYKHDDLQDNYMWCYWITPASFNKGLFDHQYFDSAMDYSFEDTLFLGPSNIKEYLTARYGEYMKLPSKEQQQAAVHAEIFDTNKDYKEYLL